VAVTTRLLLLYFALLPQGQRPPKPTMTATSEQAVRQLIESLPSKSNWRYVMEQGMKGDGIHQPWMDEMRNQGIRVAMLTIEFEWINGGETEENLKNWTLASAMYFTDYNYPDSQPLADPNRLKIITASGLEGRLEAEALSRAKQENWFEAPGGQLPPRKEGTGYVRIFLADNEWLPVEPSELGEYGAGTTPLMHAALLGDVGRIQKLLAEGVDVNAVSPDSSTALFYASSADAVQALLDAGAEVNKGTNDGVTPLMNASARGDFPFAGVGLHMVELLLKAGADPNPRDAHGHTALWIAAQKKNWDIVKLLKHAGAHE
jgi:uncharacterized protein